MKLKIENEMNWIQEKKFDVLILINLKFTPTIPSTQLPRLKSPLAYTFLYWREACCVSDKI